MVFIYFAVFGRCFYQLAFGPLVVLLNLVGYTLVTIPQLAPIIVSINLWLIAQFLVKSIAKSD